MNDAAAALLPAKLRMALYLLLGVVFAGISAWQASLGNWMEFAITLLPVLSAIVAVPNTPVSGAVQGLTGPAGPWIGATQLGDFGCPSGPESRHSGSVCGRILAAVYSPLSPEYPGRDAEKR